jgi:hypothetical protein
MRVLTIGTVPGDGESKLREVRVLPKAKADGGGGKAEFNPSPVPYLQGRGDVVCHFQRGDHPRGLNSNRDLMILFQIPTRQMFVWYVSHLHNYIHIPVPLRLFQSCLFSLVSTQAG